MQSAWPAPGSPCGLAASAQTTPVAPIAENDVMKLEKYVVTCSNQPTAGDTPVSPTHADLTPEIIANTGISNDLLQVIRKTAPQFTGNANLGGDNGNIGSGSTNGGSALARCAICPTLVLVNGRRMATPRPVGATGGAVFVDVNAIPVSAIERIEILTDGASAIYGTDAVSGVVNIILKSDFQGAELGGTLRLIPSMTAAPTRNCPAYGRRRRRPDRDQRPENHRLLRVGEDGSALQLRARLFHAGLWHDQLRRCGPARRV